MIRSLVLAAAVAATVTPVAQATSATYCDYTGYHYDAGDGDLHEGVLTGAIRGDQESVWLRCSVLRDGTEVAAADWVVAGGVSVAAGQAAFHALRAELLLCTEVKWESGGTTSFCEPLVSTRLPLA